MRFPVAPCNSPTRDLLITNQDLGPAVLRRHGLFVMTLRCMCMCVAQTNERWLVATRTGGRRRA